MSVMNLDTQMRNLIGQAQANYQQAIALLSGANVTAEDVQTAERLEAEARELKARAAKLDALHREAGEALPVANTPAGPSEFGNFAEFIRAYRSYLLTGVADPRLKKDMTGGSGAAGGFLIPERGMDEVMAVATPLTVVRSGATIINMDSRTLSVPAVDQTSTAGGQQAWFGAVMTYWQDEAQNAQISEMKFRQAELKINDLIGYTRVANSLLEDAAGLASLLSGPMGFPGAVAYAEDHAFLRGDGVGKPIGIVGAPGTHAVTRAAAGTIKYDDLAKMNAAFWGQNGVWIASIAAKETLLLMEGPTGNPSYLWGDASRGLPDQLLGRPILWTDKLPNVGTRGDIILADRSYYLVGNRRSGTTVESSRDERFQSNVTSMRIVHRVDGKPWLSAAITYDGTNKLSPFVVLT